MSFVLALLDVSGKKLFVIAFALSTKGDCSASGGNVVPGKLTAYGNFGKAIELKYTHDNHNNI